MSFNGSGTFVVNSAGQPVVANTVISATVFNALTADLATGLSTCITKDGQTTVTANIPFGNNKITTLGAGTAASDAANLGQVQSTAAKLVTVTGTDTITGTMSPALTAYAAGQLFYFIANAANTGAVTINIDGLGAKSITRDGSTALTGGDINSGEFVVIIYDGTRFQMINAANSFGNTTINGTLTVTGNTALQANVSITSTLSVGGTFAVTGAATLGSTLAVTGKSDLPTVSTASINAAVALITTGTVTNLTASGASIASANIGNLQFTAASIASINAGVAVVTNLTATSASIASMNAGVALLTTATVTSLTATGASVASANVGTAVVTGLTVTGASIASVNAGTATLSGNLTLNGGTANGVLYLNGSKVATSGSALTFDGANLGLGVTPSAWTSNIKALEGASGGALSFYAAGGFPGTFITSNAYSDGTNWIAKVTDQACLYTLEGTTGTHIWSVAASNTTAGNPITFTTAMTLNSSGNLGVGTASPTTRLSVNATASTNQAARFVISAADTSAVAAGNGGGIIFRGVFTGTTLVDGAGIHAYKANATDNNYSYGLAFTTRSNGNDLTANMRLDENGNLGLGVTPSAWTSGWKAYETAYAGNALVSWNVNSIGITANATNTATGWKYQSNGFANAYFSGDNSGKFVWYNAPSGTAGNAITFTQAMTLDASGNLLIGTTSATGKLTFKRNNVISWENSGTQDQAIYADGSSNLILYTSNTERARITAGGNLLVGTTTDFASAKVVTDGGGIGILNKGLLRSTTDGVIQLSADPNNAYATSSIRFDVDGTEYARITAGGQFLVGTTTTSGGEVARFEGSANCSVGIIAQTTGASYLNFGNTSDANVGFIGYDHTNNFMNFRTNGLERARITSAGEFVVGKTSTLLTTAGVVIEATGSTGIATGSAIPLYINRQTDDGTLIEFRQANTTEGTISVSGNTVSYNAFAGSHWSQLQDGSKPDILRGTVMESINELCVWPGEQNERLPKSKVSDTAGSKKVYGVFMAWDNDWTETNDMYVTAVGAFICRVNGSVTVQEGDLLESNGDGTARVQADDIIRSSTIGKVTSTVKTHQYDDGSYCVPTVLYCG